MGAITWHLPAAQACAPLLAQLKAMVVVLARLRVRRRPAFAAGAVLLLAGAALVSAAYRASARAGIEGQV